MHHNKRPDTPNFMGARELAPYTDPSESRELLTALARAARRAAREIAVLLPVCTDTLFADDLQSQFDTHMAFFNESMSLLERDGEELDDISDTPISVAFEPAYSLSELVSARIHRLIPLIIDVTRAIHQYSHAEPHALALARRYLAFAETTLERMRTSL